MNRDYLHEGLEVRPANCPQTRNEPRGAPAAPTEYKQRADVLFLELRSIGLCECRVPRRQRSKGRI